MESIYFEPSGPGSFGGVQSLSRYARVPRYNARNWLKSKDAYTLHKPVRYRFPRRKTYSKGINDLLQIDLVEMQPLARYNDGYRYLLTCIDVFTKKAFAAPLKDKRGDTIVEALTEILNQTRLPVQMIQSDRGTEFLNHQVQNFFKSRNINHYSSMNDDIKAAVVERFNRTLKTKMYKYFTHQNTYRWIDVLDRLLESYNNSYHRSIAMTPNQVSFDNDDIVRKRLYPIKPKPEWKFSVGDKVRISKARRVFRKGYLPGWTEEIFTIETRNPTHPVTYGLKDATGESIKGSFYEPELQTVDKTDDVYVVEKVLKTRRRRGRVEYFVKWRGYPEKFNSWTADVVKI